MVYLRRAIRRKVIQYTVLSTAEEERNGLQEVDAVASEQARAASSTRHVAQGTSKYNGNRGRCKDASGLLVCLVLAGFARVSGVERTETPIVLSMSANMRIFCKCDAS